MQVHGCWIKPAGLFQGSGAPGRVIQAIPLSVGRENTPLTWFVYKQRFPKKLQNPPEAAAGLVRQLERDQMYQGTHLFGEKGQFDAG